MTRAVESIVLASPRRFVVTRIRRILEAAGFLAEPEIVRLDLLARAVEAKRDRLVVIDGEAKILWNEIRKALAAAPDSVFVLCCGSIAPDTVQAAITSGIQGLISVHAPLDQAAQAMLQIWNGERRMCFDSMADEPPADALTPSESKVLPLAARGCRNGEIAQAIGSTEGSVRVHVHNLLRKTGAQSREELAKAVVDEPEPVRSLAQEMKPVRNHLSLQNFDSAWMFGLGGQTTNTTNTTNNVWEES